jgi:beta-galactosidase
MKAENNDMNSWVGASVGTPLTTTGGPWSIFSGSFEPFANMQRDGGVLKFGGLLGKAEVWIDGKLAATKSEFQNAPLEAPFPSGKGKRPVRILFETEGDKPLGLTAPVSVVPSETAK